MRTSLSARTDSAKTALRLIAAARHRGVVLCSNGHDVGYWPGTQQGLNAELERAINSVRPDVVELLASEWKHAELMSVSCGSAEVH